MRRPLEVTAARWHAFCLHEINREISKIKVPAPSVVDEPFLRILFQSAQLYRKAVALTSEAEDEYDSDLERRKETSARLIDPAMPVRFSSGITNIASLIEPADEMLSQQLGSIEELTEEAMFENESNYEGIAREAINISRDIAVLVRIHLHTHLWGIWINESLSQASQVYQQIKNRDEFEDPIDSIYPYVAHPPLIVATLGSTAMIEEVGGHFLKKFTDTNIDSDNTNCREVLRSLNDAYPRAEQYDISTITETVVEARNDFSHYLIERQDAIATPDISRYIELCQECIRLAGILAREMCIVQFRECQETVIFGTLET